VKIGVDSSVIVAGVHASHPRHALALRWLVQSLADHRLVVTHHSVLEAYAVLTRLPADLRVTPSEARDLLKETVQANMEVAGFPADDIWTMVESLVGASIVGGRSYDAFMLHALKAFGAEAIATLNPAHFHGLPGGLRVIDPSEPGG
jgi:predicted nucleic acid-binding protein